jgi:hypothetical protein
MYESDEESVSSTDLGLEHLVGEPMDVWIDSLVELAVDRYQKKYVFDTYNVAFHQEHVKDLTRDKVLNILGDLNATDTRYLSTYYEFYKTFIPQASRSAPAIAAEAHAYFKQYPEKNDAHGFQKHMLNALQVQLGTPPARLTPERFSPCIDNSANPNCLISNLASLSLFIPVMTAHPENEHTKLPGYGGTPSE